VFPSFLLIHVFLTKSGLARLVALLSSQQLAEETVEKTDKTSELKQIGGN